jgi:deoxyribodipyrimidine photo-lyase
MDFISESDYEWILQKLDQVDPVQYGRTRNYVNGAVTYLSPYISRGVISTRQVLKSVLNKGYKTKEIETFVRELCWRDYFQRVAQVKDLNKEIKQPQSAVSNYQIPSQILNASTGIEGIDTAVKQLYETGYMHNHCRMYTASLICNIAGSHWHHPAQWMYYHLLDGDWASNACSWQWIAGANSSKKYFANQENINKYTNTGQRKTYLDTSYEVLETMQSPVPLTTTEKVIFNIDLPETTVTHFHNEVPTFLYNYYNLDPLWHKDEPGNRILLLEPVFFNLYPVSIKCIRFMLALSKNIPGIQIFRGSFKSFVTAYPASDIIYKEHPLNTGYKGTQEERDWITTEVAGFYPSFFSYWKKTEKHLFT